MIHKFKAAQRASTPLVAIETPDPEATMRAVMKAYNGTSPPVMSWDASAGLVGMNRAGIEAFNELGIEQAMTVSLAETLPALLRLPGVHENEEGKRVMGSVVFIQNAHRFFESPAVVQGLYNLRDRFKSDNRCAVLLSPSFRLPPELQASVVVLDEQLPDNEYLGGVVRRIYEAAELKPNDEVVTKSVDALCGLAAFPAEQASAMCLTKDGMNVTSLWDAKRKMVEQTPGLSFLASKMTFEDIGGCVNIKQFMRRILRGNDSPRVIVFQDEIEKAFAGFGTDMSGTVTEQVGAVLSEMENMGYLGLLFIGHPGAAKSAVAQAAGNDVGIPTIAFDASATKGSLVGQSGEQIRQALKVIRAVSQGKALFIGTCNSFGQLPPELKRRFRLGTFYFDLPSAEEREAIWKIHCKRYTVGGETPNDNDWTGAEIRNCCEIAWRLKVSLKEAAKFIVPYALSNSDNVKSLRTQSSGKFISANYEGTYRYDDKALGRTPQRRITLEGE